MTRRGGRGRDWAQNATVTPTIRDLEWAAGFLEGEGCFSTCGGKYPSAQVDAAQIQREPLERLQRLFGGRVSVMRQGTKPDASPLWRWRVSGPRARGISMTLYSLMSTRRQGQIRDADARCTPTEIPV